MVGVVGVEPTESNDNRFTVCPATTYRINSPIIKTLKPTTKVFVASTRLKNTVHKFLSVFSWSYRSYVVYMDSTHNMMTHTVRNVCNETDHVGGCILSLR